MATNKPPVYSNMHGQPAALRDYKPVQAGSSQLIYVGEICKIRSLTDFSTYPIIPVSADDDGFIPAIADQEQKAGDVARDLAFIRPTVRDRFLFALNTATLVKNGDTLAIHNSQTLKKSSSHVVAVVNDPEIPGAGNTVSKVMVSFVQVTAAGLAQDPYIGCPAQLTEYIAEIQDDISDPGDGEAIPVTGSGTINLTIAESASETNTLAIPTYAGQELAINAATVGSSGTRTITSAQAVNQTGNTTLTFAAASDFILLKAVKIGAALRWRVAINDGVALG